MSLSDFVNEEVIYEHHELKVSGQNLCEQVKIPPHREFFNSAMALQRKALLSDEERLLEGKLEVIDKYPEHLEDGNRMMYVQQVELHLAGQSIPVVLIFLHKSAQNVFESC